MTGTGQRASRRPQSTVASTPSALDRLAECAGIVPEYLDQTGRQRRRTTDATKRALLAAMGIDASTDAAAREALSRVRGDARRELLAPVRVIRHGAAERIIVRVPSSRVKTGSWQLELETEGGARATRSGSWSAGGGAPLEMAAWSDLPLGYHRLRLTVSTGGSEQVSEQSLIVVPHRCVVPDDVLNGGKAFGIVANLYTIRSRTNWGVGDLSDLATLSEWGAANGADFIGVNPLHALLDRGPDVSPYNPVSRLFRNPIYIDLLRVPELDVAPDIRDRLLSPEFNAAIDALRESAAVRYEQVMAVKGVALDALHRIFQQRVRGTGSDRDRAYADYVARGGMALARFARWMTIAEDQARERPSDPRAMDWRTWPTELRDATSAAVQERAKRHAQRIEYHYWLQFEIDRQLAEAARRSHDAGMRIGLYQDLAIGTSPAGADTWAFPDLFVRGVTIGAPPDPYAAEGQNWGLPPIDPRALRRQGYRYVIDLLRSGFRHAGALRIDHVMGLFRLFWIPEGMPGTAGAYVRYPADELLGIVALESVRNQALVVGEDLGTVPREVPRALRKWGILSSKVLYFERDRQGTFKPARKYPRLSLATANTHDMAPLGGFWDERDIDIRAAVGLLRGDVEVAEARNERARDRIALLERLAREKVLPRSPEAGVRSPTELRSAVHGFLCRSPAQLVGLSLDDLVGEVDPVNVPGVGPDKYPSWTRKMRESLEVMMASTEIDETLRCDGRRGATTS